MFVTQIDILYTSGSYETGSDNNSSGMQGREEEVGEQKHWRPISRMVIVKHAEQAAKKRKEKGEGAGKFVI